MNLLHMTSAEIKLIYRMGLTAFLIMISPIIIMAVLGPAFSTSIDNIGNIGLAVYDTDPGFSGSMMASISEIRGITVITARSESELEHLVASGAVPLGVKLGSDASGQYAIFYRDPQKSSLATNIIMNIQSALTEKKGQFVTTSFDTIRQQMDDASNVLKANVQKAHQLNSTLSDSKQGLSNLQSRSLSIGQQDYSSVFSGMRNTISDSRATAQSADSQISGIRSQSSQLTTYRQKIASTKSRLTSIDSMLVNFQYTRQNYNNKIDSAVAKLNAYDSELSSVQSLLTMAYNAESDSTIKSYLYDSLSKVSSARSEISSSKNDLLSAQSDLNSIDVPSYRNEIAQSQTELSDVDSQLAQTQSQIDSSTTDWENKISQIQSDLDNADSNIDTMNQSALAFSDYAMFVANYSQASIDQIGAMQSSLGASTADFDRLSSQLSSGSGPDSKYLKPILLTTKDVTLNSNMISLFFPAIIGFDMIFASLLLPMVVGVYIQNQGMDQRIKDSKFGVFNFIMGRFIGNYIVAGIQLLILFLIGALLFGVSDINDYLFLGISLAIIPAVFSSFGVLLSQFVRREGTAVMLSILICIPSIFFSGALLPLELLSPLFQFFGKILPLYSVTQVMSMAAVKGLYITDALPEMLYLFVFTFFCLVAAYAVRKQQQ